MTDQEVGLFLADLKSGVDRLSRGKGALSDEDRTGFHH